MCTGVALLDGGAENVVFVDVIPEKVAITNINYLQQKSGRPKLPFM